MRHVNAPAACVAADMVIACHGRGSTPATYTLSQMARRRRGL